MPLVKELSNDNVLIIKNLTRFRRVQLGSKIANLIYERLLG